MSASELRQKATAGLIGPETPIRKGAEGQWVRAEKEQGPFQGGDSPRTTAGGQRTTFPAFSSAAASQHSAGCV